MKISQILKENEYICAVCFHTYEKGWSDEDNLAEMRKIWGKIPEKEKAVICDDCYKKRTPEEIKGFGDEYKFIKKYMPFLLPWL